MKAPAINVDSGRRPGDIFPNFTCSTTAGPINFWDWAEGNWVYILGLSGPFSASFDQLFSYAVASDVLEEAGVKVLGVSTMNHGLLQKLSADVSAIAGQSLSAKLVFDQESKLSKRFGLKEQKVGSGATMHRSFLVGPDLRIKTIELSASPIRQSCHQTMQLVASMQRAVPGSSQTPRTSDLWTEIAAPQS